MNINPILIDVISVFLLKDEISGKQYISWRIIPQIA